MPARGLVVEVRRFQELGLPRQLSADAKAVSACRNVHIVNVETRNNQSLVYVCQNKKKTVCVELTSYKHKHMPSQEYGYCGVIVQRLQCKLRAFCIIERFPSTVLEVQHHEQSPRLLKSIQLKVYIPAHKPTSVESVR